MDDLTRVNNVVPLQLEQLSTYREVGIQLNLIDGAWRYRLVFNPETHAGLIRMKPFGGMASSRERALKLAHSHVDRILNAWG